jgi:hypothetical protein
LWLGALPLWRDELLRGGGHKHAFLHEEGKEAADRGDFACPRHPGKAAAIELGKKALEVAPLDLVDRGELQLRGEERDQLGDITEVGLTSEGREIAGRQILVTIPVDGLGQGKSWNARTVNPS